MNDENDRAYVRTTEIPRWMASALGKFIPVVLVSALVNGLVLWRDLAVLRADFASLKQSFAEFSVECVARRTRGDMDHQRLSDCERRIGQIEGRLD